MPGRLSQQLFWLAKSTWVDFRIWPHNLENIPTPQKKFNQKDLGCSPGNDLEQAQAGWLEHAERFKNICLYSTWKKWSWEYVYDSLRLSCPQPFCPAQWTFEIFQNFLYSLTHQVFRMVHSQNQNHISTHYQNWLQISTPLKNIHHRNSPLR